ncbi:hypothetical protein ACOMHN_016168 [Nucella lapillus]
MSDDDAAIRRQPTLSSAFRSSVGPSSVQPELSLGTDAGLRRPRVGLHVTTADQKIIDEKRREDRCYVVRTNAMPGGPMLCREDRCYAGRTNAMPGGPMLYREDQCYAGRTDAMPGGPML